MLGSQVAPVTGSALRPAAGSAPQCHTSDTAYWTVAVASISHEHGKFLRFGFPPFDRNNIQVVMEGPVLYALRADQSMETRIVKAR